VKNCVRIANNDDICATLESHFLVISVSLLSHRCILKSYDLGASSSLNPIENCTVTATLTLRDRIDQVVFNAIYSRSLVYNTCWEDPAVDRIALELKPTDSLLVITSAGCNVLDYALAAPRRIHAVDANPRQTALLELKLASIKQLAFDDFFALFGRGIHSQFREIYFDALRRELSPFAQQFWDTHVHWFSQQHGGFYFRGLSGVVARAFHTYLKVRPRLAAGVGALFQAQSLDHQRHIYDTRVQPLMWSAGMNWTLSRQLTMNLLGVPAAQRYQVQAQHQHGVAGFIREAVEYVFRELPVWTNYFWTVYINGSYTPTCCPEYLKRDNFQALKSGLAERIVPHTSTVTAFLQTTEERISRFVLLDHMDWMSSYYPDALAEEWNAILDRATPDARVLFRSAHANPDYLNLIDIGAERTPLRQRLHFHERLAQDLQQRDRVHTYAGFHIADLVGV
jgi:S-adenosylmethionine-diacylglycerol 3-amino-3-carboxypropyl transferase